MGRRLALLIATYDYQDRGLRQLIAPAHDAQALATVLRDPQVAGFDVTVMENKPHHQVGEAVGEFYRDRRAGDLTLLYFSGHGLKDDSGQLYLAMTDTRRGNLRFTALSAENINHAVEGCLSQRNILILDCCYSGAYPVGMTPKASTTEAHTLDHFHGRGRTVLTASDSTQYAFEGDQLRGEATQSVFTRYLVEGLREGTADLDWDGDITVDELYTYTYQRVVEETPQQRPKKLDEVQGRTVIAKNINWTLPDRLRRLADSPYSGARLNAIEELERLYRTGNELVREHVRVEIQRIQRLAAEDNESVVAAAAAALLRPEGATSTSSPADPRSRPTYAPTAANLPDTAPDAPILSNLRGSTAESEGNEKGGSRHKHSDLSHAAQEQALGIEEAGNDQTEHVLNPDGAENSTSPSHSWQRYAQGVIFGIGCLLVLLAVAFLVWLPITDHRHNLATNPTAGSKPRYQFRSDAIEMQYDELTQLDSITTSFLAVEHDTRYLHVVPTLVSLSPRCTLDTSVTFSFSSNDTAEPKEATGVLTENIRSHIVEYFRVGKPTEIQFRASLKGPPDCTARIMLKDAMLHSLPPLLHSLAINSMA